MGGVIDVPPALIDIYVACLAKSPTALIKDDERREGAPTAKEELGFMLQAFLISRGYEPTASSALLLDSGASFHVAGGAGGPSRQVDIPVELSTVHGAVKCTEETDLYNGQTGNLDALRVVGSPNLASLGKLLRQKHMRFVWDSDYYDTPELVQKSTGRVFDVKVQADCPMLAGAAPKLVADGGSRETPCIDEEGSNKPATRVPIRPEIQRPTEKSKTGLFRMAKPADVERFLGMEMVLVLKGHCAAIDGGRHQSPVQKVVVSQKAYTAHILEEYRKDNGMAPNAKLKAYRTPSTEGELNGLGVCEESETRGLMAPHAPKHIGSLLFLSRCCRPDITLTVCGLGRYTSKWSTACDRALARLMGYLQLYPDVALEIRGDTGAVVRGVDTPSRGDDAKADHGEGEVLQVRTYHDSDHAGDLATSRSVSGGCTMLLGARGSRAAIAWSAKTQSCTAISSAEAEVVGGAEALRRQLLPIAGTLEEVYRLIREIQSRLCGDSAPAQAAMLAGSSKTMRYVRKLHRVSLGFLRDALGSPGMAYEREDSARISRTCSPSRCRRQPT